jgi:hypothetical protein
MTSKEELDFELRLMAIEYVLVKIGMIALTTAGITPEQAKQMRESGRVQSLKETFPGVDAAMADHVGAEIADRVEELLGRIETLVAQSNRRQSPRASCPTGRAVMASSGITS